MIAENIVTDNKTFSAITYTNPTHTHPVNS